MKSFYHHGLLINIHHKDAFLFLQVVLVMESSFCQIRIFFNTTGKLVQHTKSHGMVLPSDVLEFGGLE